MHILTMRSIQPGQLHSRPPNLMTSLQQIETIVSLRKTQTKDMLKTLSLMSSEKANNCKERTNAATQALKAYYQQPAASQYNLDEALNALVTLTEKSQKLLHAEQQKKFLEPSHKPSLSLYSGHPELSMPDHVKNQRLQPFQLPLGEESIKTHPRGGTYKCNEQKTKEIQSGLKGLCTKEGEQSGPKDKENTRIVEPLKFYNRLCKIEDSLLQVFNKLNDIQYVNGIVNLSKYTLTKSETNVLSKGLGFCPTPGPQIFEISSKTWMYLKRKQD